MFRHEGPSRSTRKNTVLAAYLAFVAGFVNSGGFLLMGSFTSHVTGSVGRLGNDIAAHDTHAALTALLLVITFFLGAFFASLILSAPFRVLSSAYGTALLVECLLVAAFVLASSSSRTVDPRILDLQAALLCAAMGVQNSLVTRLSGAVIRTTHLTGVLTDLGIDTAQWVRWLRSRAHATDRASLEPRTGRSLLLLTIVLSFTGGATCGAALTLHHAHWAMLIPTFALLAASAYAYQSRPTQPAQSD